MSDLDKVETDQITRLGVHNRVTMENNKIRPGEVSLERKRVYIIDDDAAVRDSLCRFLRISGFDANDFASADLFLASLSTIEPGCVVLDIHMPGLSGLDAQQLLKDRGSPLPVIILTGSADIAMAVRAMKNGAVEFIEKPYEGSSLLAALGNGFDRLEERRSDAEQRTQAQAAVGSLTPREREVLQGLLAGMSNKLISYRLGLSTRTVEVYRGHVMDKLGVKSLSAAVRLALSAGVEPMSEEA